MIEEILNNESKYKNKAFSIGMLVLGYEDIKKFKKWFDENDIFEILGSDKE